MSVFTEAELAYMRITGLLARVATVGEDGMPHLAPVGMWSQNPQFDAIDVTGTDFDHTKKFRDAARSGVAAIVIDDIVKLDPAEVQPGGWDSRPRGIEIRGRAEAIADPRPMIRIHPHRIVSWGLEGVMQRYARNVAESEPA
jgi:pyridoxamine 5'-phosphate oxidase family protein